MNYYETAKTPDNMSENETSSNHEKKRYRITRACDYCRKKKVKCYFTPGQACSNCTSIGISCEFNDGAKKRGPPKGYIDALEKRIKKIEESLQNQHQQSYAHQSPSPAPSFRQDSIPSLGNKKTQGSSADKVQYLGDMSSFQFFSNKMHLDDNNSDTKWKGHHIRKFGKQVVLVEDDEEKESEILPQAHLLPHLKPIHYWIYSVTGVDKHTSDRLLKIYFANIHPVLPVVNKTAFLKQYRDQADSYPSADLLNAMFGAAARFVECEAHLQKSTKHNHRPPDAVWDVPLGWSDQFFDQAQTIISASASSPTVSKVQAIILIHNHSGNLDSKSSACWLLGGLAIRLAQGLGLNRDCEEWDIPEDEKQTRKRIWWSLYVADRFHSASLGRPLSIRDEDNDVGYPDAAATWKEVLDEPDNPSAASLNEPRFPSAMCRPKKTTAGKVGIYQLFVELIKLSEILGRILQGLYTPKAKKVGLEQGSDAIVTNLDHQLTEWRFGFPEALQKANFEDFDESKGYLAPVTASVLLCYFSLLILLHRPFIEAIASGGKKARPSYSSFRIGTSAATRGMRIASQMTVRDFLMFPYSFSLYPILQCCLIHMYNTKNPDTRISGPAKADLTKGMALIARLRVMSNTAQRLHNLLKVIMSNKEIEVTVPPSDSEESSSVRSRDNSVDSNSHMPSRLSDVGRGGSSSTPRNIHHNSTPTTTTVLPPPGRGTPVLTQSPKEHYAPMRQFQQSLSEVIVPPNMDGSMSQSSAPSPTSMSEAFSLQQFGFNKNMGDPSQLDYTTQDVSSFSKTDNLPPMPMYTATNYHPNMPMQPSLAYIPSTTSNTTTTMTPMPSTQAFDQQEGVFKNNPNNPFFGIPSSMDWTEWNEWNQSNQGTTNWQQLV